MKRETFAALAGTFIVLFVLSASWTAFQVHSRGVSHADAPVFPAMSLGALTSVLLWQVLSTKDIWNTALAWSAIVLNWALVTVGALTAWFLILG